MSNPNSEQLQSVAGSVADEYDRDHNAEVLADYEGLLSVLRELHELHPKWRFGQMIGNLAAWSGTTKPGEVYDVPDEHGTIHLPTTKPI